MLVPDALFSSSDVKPVQAVVPEETAVARSVLDLADLGQVVVAEVGCRPTAGLVTVCRRSALSYP